MASLVRKSPLDGRAPWQGESLRIEACAATRQLLLRGRLEESVGQRIAALLGCGLPATPIFMAHGKRAQALMLAPSRWMIFDRSESSPALLLQLQGLLVDNFVAVSDVSDGYAHIRIEGSLAIDLLAAGTAVDLHPRLFKIGQAAQTELARTRCLVWRTEGTAYDLLVDVSAGDYVWAWLTTNAALAIAVHRHCGSG